MKKLIPFFLIIFLLSSCDKNLRTVTIRDEEGLEHTAGIAPVAYGNYLGIGHHITIMEPQGWLRWVSGPVYNFDWKQSDTTDMFGLVKRKITTGEIIAVN